MRFARHIFLFISLYTSHLGSLHAQWTQIGGDIDGKTNGDKSGYTVSLSSDGSMVAIGSPNNAGGGGTRGLTRIFRNINDTWAQLGNDINGETDFDQSGWSVSLSGNGNRVAISSIYNKDNSSQGHVRIFELKNNLWIQLGEDIDGKADGDNSGTSISMSANGDRIVIGAPNNAGGGMQRGHLRVYEFISNKWTQLGADIDGEGDNDNLGSAVAMSGDGLRIAAGAINNEGGGSQRGQARLFQYNGAKWEQLGADIDGEADNDYFGSSVSLSADGKRLAIGAIGSDAGGFNSGQVRIFEVMGNSLTLMSDGLKGKGANNQFGGSVSLSADGTKLAVGARFNNGGGYRRGQVQMFTLKGATWSLMGEAINGEADNDLAGLSVSMAADGNRLAIGAPFNGGKEGSLRGHTRVFQIQTTPSPIHRDASTVKTEKQPIPEPYIAKKEEKPVLAEPTVATKTEVPPSVKTEKTTISEPIIITKTETTPPVIAEKPVLAEPIVVTKTEDTPSVKIEKTAVSEPISTTKTEATPPATIEKTIVPEQTIVNKTEVPPSVKIEKPAVSEPISITKTETTPPTTIEKAAAPEQAAVNKKEEKETFPEQVVVSKVEIIPTANTSKPAFSDNIVTKQETSAGKIEIVQGSSIVTTVAKSDIIPANAIEITPNNSNIDLFENSQAIEKNDKVLRGVKLFPNQSSGMVNIQNGGQIINNIIVTSTMGEVLITRVRDDIEPEKSKGLVNFNAQGLVKGVYLVHIVSGNKVATLKLMRE